MNIKSLLAGAALAALSTSAFAGTTNLGALAIPATGSASVSGSSSETAGPVDEIYTVDVTGVKFSQLTASLTISNLNFSGTWYLYEGTPTGALLGSVATFQGGGSTFASVSTGVGVAGPYYAELIGTATGPVAPGVSFTAVAASAVPEASTWVMMLAGFGALGFAGYRRRALAA
jgi:hypothetical protein